jgi:hypothetical protein
MVSTFVIIFHSTYMRAAHVRTATTRLAGDEEDKVCVEALASGTSVGYGTIPYVVPTTAKKMAASFGSGSCGRAGEDALHLQIRTP